MLRPRDLPSPSSRVGIDTGGLTSSAKDAAKEAAVAEAKKRLKEWGLSDDQIALLSSALGMSPDALVAFGREKLFEKLADAKIMALAYAKAKINEQAVKTMMDLGFSRADAEALAATGGDPDRLKALGRERLKDLLVDITARAKKEGIDIAKMAGSKIGMTPEQMSSLTKGASIAYDIFGAVLDASQVLGASRTYSQQGWSGEFEGDKTLRNLATTLDSMASQSDVIRQQREAAYRGAYLKIAAAAATTGPIGIAVGVALVAVAEGLKALGFVDTGADANDGSWRDKAVSRAKRLWDEYGMIAPAYDSSAYSLASYADDALDLQLQLLDEAEAEQSFKNTWREIVTWAIFQPLEGGAVKAHPAATDLVLLEWMPFQFSEWMGGAVSPVMSNLGWSLGGSGEHPYVMAPNDASWIQAYPQSASYGALFRTMPDEARSRLLGGAQLPAWYPVTNSTGFKGTFYEKDGSPAAPRSYEVQRVIRDRIAATVATLVAASRSVRVESVVEAAVLRGKSLYSAHGFNPQLAAKDFRDVFLAAVAAANASDKKTIHFKNVPDLSNVVALKRKITSSFDPSSIKAL